MQYEQLLIKKGCLQFFWFVKSHFPVPSDPPLFHVKKCYTKYVLIITKVTCDIISHTNRDFSRTFWEMTSKFELTK